LRKRVQIPLVIFSYYNPIHAMGLHHFAEQARQAGVDGVLVPDLPPEEGGPLRKALGRVKIPLIFLLSPTSTPARIRRVGRESQGFIYYVSRTGVTGAQKKLDRELVKQVARVKRLSRLPVVIGFGISGPKQAAAAAHMADGVVIGSALMERLLQTGGEARGVQKASRFAKQISSAVKRG
jgi:tryptophan synthase alpha chain